MQRVAIYTRISANRSGDGLGVARQEEDCRKLAEEKGLKVVAVIEDNNTSAFRPNKLRKGWEEVKALVENGHIEGVVAWHTDRMYRHPTDLEKIISLVEEKELTIYTVTAGDLNLSTPSGRSTARIHGAMSRQEVEQKAQRQSRKMLQSARDGQYSGGRLPLGYKLGPTKGTLEINEDEARVLREAGRRLLTGHSVTGTALWAAQETGRPIRPVTIKKALTSYLIAGFREHVPQAQRNRWADKRKNGLVSGEPKGTVYPAQWEPILDQETWKQLRALLLDPQRKTQRKRPVKSLLGGLLYCALCGTTLGYSEASYKCPQSGKKVKDVPLIKMCGKVAIATPAVERHVTRLVKEAFNRTLIENVEEDLVEKSDTQSAREHLQKTRSNFYDLHLAEKMPYDDLVRQLDIIDAKLKELDQVEVEVIQKKINRNGYINGAERWDDLNVDQRRQIIEHIFRGFVVYPHAVSLTFEKPKHGPDPATLRFNPYRVRPVLPDDKYRNKPKKAHPSARK